MIRDRLRFGRPMFPRGPLWVTLISLALGACGGADPAPSPQAPSSLPTGPSTIDLRIDAIVDLYLQVRAMAASGETVEKGPYSRFEGVTRSAQGVADLLGGHRGWGPLDGLIGGLAGIEDLRARVADLPNPVRLRDGREVELRQPAMVWANTLTATYPGFMEELWPERLAALEAVRASLEEQFTPTVANALAYHLESLGMEDPGLVLPVYLVTRTLPPGASTLYGADGQSFSLVQVSPDAVDTGLFETLLHEVTHSLDIAAQDDIFDRLRDRLRAVHGPGHPAVRGMPHALMFVQSAATVQRLYAPHHLPYGETSGVYERLGPGIPALRGIWQQVLDGTMERDDALDAMVAAAGTDPAPSE